MCFFIVCWGGWGFLFPDFGFCCDGGDLLGAVLGCLISGDSLGVIGFINNPIFFGFLSGWLYVYTFVNIFCLFLGNSSILELVGGSSTFTLIPLPYFGCVCSCLFFSFLF